MRCGTVIARLNFGGRVRQAGKFNGNIETVTEQLRELCPQIGLLVIKEGLRRAAWEHETVWIGDHSLGLEILEISNCNATLKPKTYHLDDTQ